MATAPTRIGAFIEATTANYSSTTTPKSAAQRTDLVTGDLLIVTASAEHGYTTALTPTHTGTASITWTQLVEAPAAVDDQVSYVCAWAGEVTAGGTMTLTVDRTGNGASTQNWGFSGALYRAHGGVGNFTATSNTTNGQRTVVCSDNSALLGQINDWNAIDGSGRTWLSINGTAIAESLYYSNPGVSHSVYGGRSPDVGSAGSKTWGISAPAGLKAAVVVVEVLGDPAPPVFDGEWLLEDGSGSWLLEDGSGVWVTEDYTGGGPTPATGSGTGALGFVGTASGKRTPKASSAGSVALTGTATGKRLPKANAAGSLTIAGTAVGDAPSPPPSTGSGTGTVTLAGSATGKRVAKASSSGTVTFTGSASGRTVKRGSGTGSLSFTGTATGKRPAKGSGNATLAFVGTATGKRTPKANGTGGLTLTGTAVGNSPTPGLKEGYGTGSLTWAGTATGRRTPKGGGTAALAFTGSATGKRTPKASGIGLVSLASTAVGRRSPAAVGVGTLTLVGTGVGVSPVALPPTEFEGHILTARLSILATSSRLTTIGATGELSTLAAEGELDTPEANASLSIPQATGVLT